MAGEARANELAELETIRVEHGGVLRPIDVVQFAENPASALHSRFQWDDAKAAYEHRLQQARELITVYVNVLPRGNDEPQQVYVSLTDDRKAKGGGYRLIVDVLSDPASRAAFLADALAEFERAEVKYGRLKELADVFAAVRKVRKSKIAKAA